MSTRLKKRIETLLDNLTQDFSLDTLSKSPARFNKKKLDWFNREYIKMMSLNEFALRSIQNRWQRTLNNYTFRKGVYILPVDFNKNLVFTDHTLDHYGQDGHHYMIGGGVDSEETEIDTLLREIREETHGELIIDENKLIRLGQFDLPTAKPFKRGTTDYNGKTFVVYIYPMDSLLLKPLILTEEGDDELKTWAFGWRDLGDFLGTNDLLTYPIWKDFCNKNRLTLAAPDFKIKQNYLATLLDKNRVTTLSEANPFFVRKVDPEANKVLSWTLVNEHDHKPDSWSITRYTAPTFEDLQWKKITLEESLTNLKEVFEFIADTYPKLEPLQKKLYAANITNKDVEEKFVQIYEKWESLLKEWLASGEKNVGDYLWPLRVALSGQKKSPSPFELLSILTWEQVEERINTVLKS